MSQKGVGRGRWSRGIPKNVTEYDFRIERAKSNRSHCARSFCDRTSRKSGFTYGIPIGFVRLVQIKPDFNERAYCLRPDCITKDQVNSILECGKYSTLEELPGLEDLPEDMRAAALTVLESIKDGRTVSEDTVATLEQSMPRPPRAPRRPHEEIVAEKKSKQAAAHEKGVRAMHGADAATSTSSAAAAPAHGSDVSSSPDDQPLEGYLEEEDERDLFGAETSSEEEEQEVEATEA